MSILLIKTSSLGDVIHALPALTDARRAIPDLTVDWVVEEQFAEIPTWHPAVRRVIPVALRRWRRHPWRAWHSGEWRHFFQELRSSSYDRIIDAQGLLKSALIGRLARGRRCGLDVPSIKEPWAVPFYQERYQVAKGDHAIDRVRHLLAAALGIPPPLSPPDYGLDRNRFTPLHDGALPYFVFLHGSSWPAKLWPESHWQALGRLAGEVGLVYLPWGSVAERQRAERIAAALPERMIVPPHRTLGQLATLLAHAQAVVGVDTGAAHLAAALGTPGITLYGATQPQRTGTVGERQNHLVADYPCLYCLKRRCKVSRGVPSACLAMILPQQVWEKIEKTKS